MYDNVIKYSLLLNANYSLNNTEDWLELITKLEERSQYRQKKQKPARGCFPHDTIYNIENEERELSLQKSVET